MKLNRALIALTLAFVVALSFAAMIQKQKEFDATFEASAPTTFVTQHDLLTFPSTFNLASAMAEKAPLQTNFTRNAILNFVTTNPGVQFRAICSSLGLTVGVVQFHIAVLQKAGLVTYIRKGKYKRFFAAGKFSKKQMETIAHLRLNTVKNIFKALLEGKNLSHHELAMHVSISSQGLTWQMNRLRETGFIAETRNGLNVTYALHQTCVPLVADAFAALEIP